MMFARVASVPMPVVRDGQQGSRTGAVPACGGGAAEVRAAGGALRYGDRVEACGCRWCYPPRGIALLAHGGRP